MLRGKKIFFDSFWENDETKDTSKIGIQSLERELSECLQQRRELPRSGGGGGVWVHDVGVQTRGGGSLRGLKPCL